MNNALQVVAPGRAEIVQLEQPAPRAGEILLEIEAVTTCPHWDMHIYDGVPMFEDRPLSYPYTPGEPGHEAVGRVAAVGQGVEHLSVGQRVAAWRDPGGRRQGCYANFVCIDADHAIVVGDKLKASEIASLELAMCVQVSVDQLAEVGAIVGRSVAVAGLGAAGLIAVQMLRHAGAGKITAIEPDEGRHDLGRELGASNVIVPEELPEPDRFGKNAFHSALDTSGLKVSIEALMPRCLRAVSIFGVLREQVIFGSDQWWGGFSLIGYGEHNRNAAARALTSIREGGVKLDPLVSQTLPLAEYGRGVTCLKERRAIKVMFIPPGSTIDE